jgi:hypothetical protein
MNHLGSGVGIDGARLKVMFNASCAVVMSRGDVEGAGAKHVETVDLND